MFSTDLFADRVLQVDLPPPIVTIFLQPNLCSSHRPKALLKLKLTMKGAFGLGLQHHTFFGDSAE